MGRALNTALTVLGAALAIGLAAPAAHAGSIDISVGDRITLDDGVGNGSGGEFDAVLQTWNGSKYVDTATSWATFCLESDEGFVPGGLLRVADISDTAQNGGSNTNSGDPISYATAWLYTQFWNGDLDGLNAAGTAVSGDYLDDHAANATHLQNAIWYLEDESTGVNNHYVTLAQGAGWTTLGNVQVLNLERYSNGSWIQAQDQLVMVPVPEPASLVLLGLGLAGAAYTRRRQLLRAR